MQRNNFKIEFINKSEISFLCQFFPEYFNEIAPYELVSLNEFKKVLLVMHQNKSRKFFWAYTNEEKCGFTIISFENNIPDLNKKKGRINEFYIFKEYRKQKIGTLFFNSLVDYFKSQNIDEITIEVHFENEIGFKFWETMGFNIKKFIMKKMILE